MGVQKIYYPIMIGRINLDTYLYFKTSQYRLRDYKLNTLSKFLLNDDKIDMPIMEMNRLWKMRDDAGMARVCDYCFKDVILPLSLLEVEDAMIGYVESSRITRTPLSVLVVSGQRVKVLNQVYFYAEHRNMFVNSFDIPKTKYQGATVLPPKFGYHEQWIDVCDFASLYPSIIQQYNLCPSTLILDWKENHRIYKRLKNYKEYKMPNGKIHRFVKKSTLEGIIPDMERHLLAYRKRTKKEMKKAKKNSREYKRLNAKQMAIKVSCNSIYGFFGVRQGALKCQPVAEVTTFIGRQV